jgi:hypothetical protein
LDSRGRDGRCRYYSSEGRGRILMWVIWWEETIRRMVGMGKGLQSRKNKLEYITRSRRIRKSGRGSKSRWSSMGKSYSWFLAK